MAPEAQGGERGFAGVGAEGAKTFGVEVEKKLQRCNGCPPSSKLGTYKTAKARFWSGVSGQSR